MSDPNQPKIELFVKVSGWRVRVRLVRVSLVRVRLVRVRDRGKGDILGQK